LTEEGRINEISGVNMRPAIVVLPFDNMSGDPEQDYFSDGFTEDLTTGLARIPGFLVVARNTAFTYKGKQVDARALRRELGVRYVLEGSARQQGERLRVNTQLIETTTGTHVWAERFDRPMEDIFIVQDALVDRIIGSVAASLRRHEGERAMLASEETLAAYDLTLRARLLFRRNTLEALTEARTILHQANKIDPEYSLAFSLLAQVENFFFTNRLSIEYALPETADRVIDAAARAVILAPEDAFVHAVYGMSLRLKGDYETAANEARNALKLAPNDPQVLASVSVILLSVGDYQSSVETMQLAWALDPHLSPVFIGGILAQGQFALGDYNASKQSAQDCLTRVPDDVRCLESLVRALGELGPPEKAQRAVDDLLNLSPNYTISEYIRRASKNRFDKTAISQWADGLRKAGVPE
jgi:adenylate cyclase